MKISQVKTRKYIIVITIFIFAIAFFSACSSKITIGVLDTETFQNYVDEQTVIKAKVLEIISDETVSEDYYGSVFTIQTIMFSSIILESDMKGQIIYSRQTIDSQSYKVNAVKKNDLVYLLPSIEDDNPIGDFVEYSRIDQILWFFALFAAVLIIFSGFKGLRSLIALILTCFAIFFVFLPAIKNGYSPTLYAILISILVTIVTLSIVCGINRKALSALLGCMLGILVAGALAFIMQKTMNMSGLSDEHSILLSVTHNLNMNGIMFAAVIIGSLGATMDVAVSIASSLEEVIKHAKNDISKKQIIKSGMRIGSDIMGTMINTLILAYVGSALPIIILLSLNSVKLEYAISWELISGEFLRALAGSIGLIFVVPATSITTMALYHKKKASAELSEQIPDETKNPETK